MDVRVRGCWGRERSSVRGRGSKTTDRAEAGFACEVINVAKHG